MMKTKNKWIIAAAALVILSILSGCAGVGVSKWKPYVGAWAVPDKPTMQLEITPNGEGFLLRIYSHNFFGVNGGVKHNDHSLQPQGDVLAVRTMLGDVPLIHDARTDTLSFDGKTYRRQTAEDKKKLEELKSLK